MNTIDEPKMSVSSSLSTQQAGTIYISNGNEQAWSPDTNNYISKPNTVMQWPGVHYDDNHSMLNGSGPMYNLQKTNTGENINYFNPSYNINPSNKDYTDLTHQKREVAYSNSQYIPNGTNIISNVSYNGVNNVRNGNQIYANSQASVQRIEHPCANINDTWNNVVANKNNGLRTNWNTNKVSHGIKKPKRVRTAFTTQQMMELELEYARTRYLDRNRRIELSETLHLSEKTIKVWFQNRRMKDKKDRAEGIEDLEATSTTELSPEIKMPPPPPYNNYHQTVSYNGMYSQGNIHMECYQIPMPVLDTSAIPVPVHNAVVNAYPNFFTQPLPNQINSPISNFNNQQEEGEPDVQNIDAESENTEDISPEVNESEVDSITEDNVNENQMIKEEWSSENSNGQSNTSKVGGENWELSWVRIMDMNDEV